MIASEFRGAYDGAGNPVDGAPEVTAWLRLLDGRPEHVRLVRFDAPEPPDPIECIVVLSEARPPLTNDMLARAVVVLEALGTVAIIGASEEDVSTACAQMLVMSGCGGRS